MVRCFVLSFCKYAIPVLAMTTSLLGCGEVVVGGFGEGAWWHRAPEPVRARHPLGGAPLVGGAKPRDPDLVRARADRCRPWPITDQVEVDVGRDKVCVRQEVHVLSYESGALPVPSLPAEISSSTGGTRKISLSAQPKVEKMGTCDGLDSMRTAVWVREYAACIPNDKLVEARTETLALSKPSAVLTPGYETIRWTFDPATPSDKPHTRRSQPAGAKAARR